MRIGKTTRKQLWPTQNSKRCAEQFSHSNRNIQPMALLRSTPKLVPKFNPFKHLSFNKYDGFYHKNNNSKTDGQKHVVCVNFRVSVPFNPLNPELNPICYLLALLQAHDFLHVSRIRVKLLTFRLLMSYIYEAPILNVSRSPTTTQHSR
jgi:hypothetical protein